MAEAGVRWSVPPAQHPGLVFSGPVAAGKKPQILQETVSVTVLYLPGGQGLGAKVCDVQEDTHWWTMWTPFW